MIKEKTSAKTITANDGLNVYYWPTRRADLKKNTVVIHPGGGMNHSSLLTFERKLNERGYPTVLIEPRGIGYSKTPRTPEYFTLEKYSSDLQRIIEQEGIENPSLFAHSFGGMISFDYAARTQNAKDITGACVSHNFNHTTLPYLGAWLFANVLPIIDVTTSLGLSLFQKLKTGEKPAYADQSDLEGKGILNFLPAINNISLKEALSHFLTNRSLTSWDVSGQLKELNIPIHLIHGYTDFMVMPFAAEMIKKRSSGIVTSDKVWGDHTLPYSNPQKVIDLMTKRYEEDETRIS